MTFIAILVYLLLLAAMVGYYVQKTNDELIDASWREYNEWSSVLWCAYFEAEDPSVRSAAFADINQLDSAFIMFREVRSGW